MENAVASRVDAGIGLDLDSGSRWRDPRLAVREGEIICLVCERPFRQITNTHLRHHQLTAAEYKSRFGYNRRRPLMCQALVRLYAARAVESKLASRINQRPIVLDPELRRLGGKRPMSLEERLTRIDARRKRLAVAGETRRAALLVALSARARRRGSPAMAAIASRVRGPQMPAFAR